MCGIPSLLMTSSITFLIYQPTAYIRHLEVVRKRGESSLANGVPVLKHIPDVPYEMLTVFPAGSLLSQVSKPEDKHYAAVDATNSIIFEWLQKERGRVEDQKKEKQF